MTTVMTKKQVVEINHKCSNSWKFDTTFFVFHSVKSLFKKLKVDNTGYLRYTFLLLRQEVSYKSELQQKNN